MRPLLYFCLFAVAMAAPLAANESTPLLYTRTRIVIERHSIPSLPWQEEEKADAETPSPAISFDTEIRDGATLYNQEGWYNLTGQSTDTAVMLVFGAPVLAPVIPSSYYAPTDILLLDKEGKVLEIFPSLKLSALQEEIYPSEPISAFLFLKGGTAKALFISPGDYINYQLFKRPPKVIKTPPKPPAPITPPVPPVPPSANR